MQTVCCTGGTGKRTRFRGAVCGTSGVRLCIVRAECVTSGTDFFGTQPFHMPVIGKDIAAVGVTSPMKLVLIYGKRRGSLVIVQQARCI